MDILLEDCKSVATLQGLADASRDERWRPSLRVAASRLDLLSLLRSPLGQDAKFVRQMLRLTGNLCINDIPSKEYASSYLSEITTCLKTMPDNFDVAAGTIANIFTDHPAAPIKLAVQSDIPELLAKGLVVDRLLDLDSPITEAVVYVLANVIDAYYKSTTEAVSSRFIHSMLQMPILFRDHELYDDILAVVVILLENDMAQNQIANSHADILVEQNSDGAWDRSPLVLFTKLYDQEVVRGRADQAWPSVSAEEDNIHDVSTSTTPSGLDLSTAAANPLVHALQNVAGGIASHMKYHNLETGMNMDPVLQHFTTVTREDCILTRSAEACLAFVYLGNLARSKEICVNLVQKFDFHDRAISIIHSLGEEFTELKYLAVGYLCNLANAAEEHKAIIYRSKVIPKLIAHAPPQRLSDGLRLLRAVIKNSLQHCTLLLSPNTDSPDCLIQMSDLEERLPTMTPSNTVEVARLVVAILRTLHLGDLRITSNDFMSPAFTNCLLALTEQGVQSPIAPEGILGFALVAQTPAGVSLVATSLGIAGNLSRFLKAVGHATDDVSKENLENALLVLSKIDDEKARDAARELLTRLEGK
ncbi:hypothetical protein FKW77_006501 [Venturia effusa]|uniref:UNC-45/Cro1/She4 central domain-containing protein n=1 Tax=Venturia effusa TaxID=50376 RepID=A0A517LJ27_9PEZI|nr:hypothetical protein FKW77_006501 [Venturia effusa]